jgi:tetratricopeptide (TPR) repeat protein
MTVKQRRQDMRCKKIIFFLFFLFMMFIWTYPSGAQTGSQQETLKQYITDLQKNPDDFALREKIIKHVQTMKPQPTLPDEAERFLSRGKAAVKIAKEPKDYHDAAVEFEKALQAAPWLGDAYYNLGIIQEKAGDLSGAMRNLKLYLLASPGATDTKEVKDLIYELEFRQEKADKERREKKEASARLEQAERLLQLLSGAWNGLVCYNNYRNFWDKQDESYLGCNFTEKGESKWHAIYTGGDEPFKFFFKFPGDGTVMLDSDESWGECKGKVYGIVQGTSLSDIRWEVRPETGTPKQVYSEIRNDGTSLTISCDRPLSSPDPNVRYNYIYYKRPKR